MANPKRGRREWSFVHIIVNKALQASISSRLSSLSFGKVSQAVIVWRFCDLRTISTALRRTLTGSLLLSLDFCTTFKKFLFGDFTLKFCRSYLSTTVFVGYF